MDWWSSSSIGKTNDHDTCMNKHECYIIITPGVDRMCKYSLGMYCVIYT
jgi:hypothetical protein